MIYSSLSRTNAECELETYYVLGILHSVIAKCVHYCECELSILLRIIYFAIWVHCCEYNVLRV
jgi:hypothetical protein